MSLEFRTSHLWALTIVLLGAIGCSDAPETTATADTPARELAPIEAGVAETIPDLRSYLLGDEPSPSAPQRDPFQVEGSKIIRRSAATPSGAAPPRTVRLQGILDRDGVWIALLDGRSVGVGDVHRGWRVESIDATGVTLHRDGARRKLPW